MKYRGSLAALTALLSVNTTCNWFIHQPQIMNLVKKLK